MFVYSKLIFVIYIFYKSFSNVDSDTDDFENIMYSSIVKLCDATLQWGLILIRYLI